VRYVAQGAGYAFYLTQREVVMVLTKSHPRRGVTLGLRFLGSRPDAALVAGDGAPGTVSYLRGNDPKRWQRGLGRYREARYRGLWRGIDVALRGRAGSLKYEFRLQPNATVSSIQLGYRGARGLALGADGGLLVRTALGVLHDAKPVAYQLIGGRRVPVASRYVVSRDTYGFAVGRYDHARPLVIDPGLDYATFIGGSSNESVVGLAVDGTGSTYLVGTTQSTDFPTTAGAFDRTFNGGIVDVFVAKLNPTGSGLTYSTYIGGTPAAVPAGGSDPFEYGRAIAVDSAGNAYVAGQTTSGNFPTTAGAFDRTLNVGTFDATDAFALKLNPSGSGLVYSTFLGGTDIDDGMAIAVDSTGRAVVGGETGSTDFPTTAGAFDRTTNGAFDTFALELNATGSALVFSTFLGGTQVEYPNRVAVDSTGVYVGGITRSPDFPTTAGAFDTTLNGTAFDLYVTKLNATGSGLVYSTFIGGTDFDSGGGMTVSGGNVYLAAGTASTDFPTTAGAFTRQMRGTSDGVVLKLNATGSQLVYSTYLGGFQDDSFGSVAVDAAGDAWLAGGSSSPDYPITANAVDTTLGGSGDAVVTELSPTGSSVLYSTFLGGSNSEGASSIALLGSSLYIAGGTFSADFPTTPGAFDRTWAGDLSLFWGDGYAAKITPQGTAPPAQPPPSPPPPAPAISFMSVDPTSIVGGNPVAGGVTLTDPAPAGGALVSLSSSAPFAGTVSVPPSVTVPAGATSATFTVTTSPVSESEQATITGSWNGSTKSATLIVVPDAPPPSPPPPGPLPAPSQIAPAADAVFAAGSSVFFDWSDVSGAAGYTLQVDDSSTFTAPLTVSQNITASQSTVAGLPTQRLWWRVRAFDSGGNPGTWSGTRRFELK
jgi:hypothetical protein